eukprot:CAMPEP_0197849698 /NCGR_PEP_ID=MMETSP1438-20131217/12911_1 /TAXON_ID=1461541 /ORGANISM="Pterosperma sp., Strain CCMP1384" /LENGTH=30 /DNA_ID= /DNA_START= /DNA_END= /DNA_ORIENTATION=
MPTAYALKKATSQLPRTEFPLGPLNGGQPG